MSANTKIEWCDHTVNLWRGCDKVSPGCANCYAAAMDVRFRGGLNWKGLRTDQRESGTDLAMRLNRKAGKLGIRYRVFNGSVNDWLDDKVPEDWLAELMELIRYTPNLDWLLLTKRPENWKSRIVAAHESGRYGIGTGGYTIMNDWLDGMAPPNVWIGTTVENQAMADKRIPQLLSIPAKVRFLSCEPLLDKVSIRQWLFRAKTTAQFPEHARQRIHWVICGGESGPKARPMHPDWARSLMGQCAAASVPFFFKQWGEWLPVSQLGDAVANIDRDDLNHMPCHIFPHSHGVVSHRCGKKSAGRLLDGREHNEFPMP